MTKAFEIVAFAKKLEDNSRKNLALGLKAKIDNEVYKEWVDGLIAYRDDKNLKHTLLLLK